MEEKIFYPGDIVLHNGKQAMVLGTYALFHANDMDGIRPNDHRFEDYRIMYLDGSMAPLGWVRNSEMEMYTSYSSYSTEHNIKSIYELIRQRDAGTLGKDSDET